MKLDGAFYQHSNVLLHARELLGKVVFTSFDGKITAGIISETEAYNGIHDKASHAYNNRYTPRTHTMYQKGGIAYVYLCYGVHSLFNIVTGPAGNPLAVLVRAVIPYSGVEIMLQRLGKMEANKNTFIGPGKVSKALGIHYRHSGIPLTGDVIWIEDTGLRPGPSKIQTTSRIGVDYAGEDKFLPYRFFFSKLH